MDTVTAHELRLLTAATQGPCVSIYLPTQRIAIKEIREDMMRFRHLLNAAGEKLVGEGLTVTASRRFLKAAYALLDDEVFWKNQGKGLAVFISPAGMKTYRVPLTFPAAACVGDRFHITPLLQLSGEDQTYYLMALSRGAVRVYQGNQRGVEEIHIAGMPESEDAALWYRESERLMQMRSGSGEAGSYHGEGEDTREPNAEIREYLLKVDDAIIGELKNGPTPLVIIGLSPIPGMYKKLTKYQAIAGEVQRDPNRLDEAQLHALAWPLIEPLSVDPVRLAKNQYGSLAAKQPERVLNNYDDIATAAEAGRVDTLLIARPMAHDEVMAFGEVVESAHGSEAPMPSDHMERAAQATITNSGKICFVPAEEMPGGAAIAAILRY